MLEAGRRDFLNALSELSPGVLRLRSSSVWSPLDCIEHVVLFEHRYLDWLGNSETITPRPDTARELRLFNMIRSRLTKREAPNALWPTGKFKSLAEAQSEFQATRDRSVEVVEQQGENLYSLAVTHPHFGELNGVELIQLIDGHARRHAEQIREL